MSGSPLPDGGQTIREIHKETVAAGDDSFRRRAGPPGAVVADQIRPCGNAIREQGWGKGEARNKKNHKNGQEDRRPAHEDAYSSICRPTSRVSKRDPQAYRYLWSSGAGRPDNVTTGDWRIAESLPQCEIDRELIVEMVDDSADEY